MRRSKAWRPRRLAARGSAPCGRRSLTRPLPFRQLQCSRAPHEVVQVGREIAISVVVSTLDGENSGGLLFQQLESALADISPIDRTAINALDDATVKSTLKKIGRKKLIMPGLSAETSVTLTALAGLRDDYEVFVVTDACGGVNRDVYERSIARTIDAGAVPTTWQQVTCELHSDWARKETAEPVQAIIRNHFAGFAMGTFLPHAGNSGLQHKQAGKRARAS